MSKFENHMSLGQESNKKEEETAESINKDMAEAMKSGNYDKVAELAQKAKELEAAKNERAKSSTEEVAERGSESKSAGAESYEKNNAEAVEDRKIENYVEANKEQIKGSAEKWLKAKEAGFGEKNKWMLRLAGLGAAVAGSVEVMLHAINNPDVLAFGQRGADAGTEVAIAVAIVTIGGAIAGGMIGKFSDFIKRKKQKNNK